MLFNYFRLKLILTFIFRFRVNVWTLKHNFDCWTFVFSTTALHCTESVLSTMPKCGQKPHYSRIFRETDACIQQQLFSRTHHPPPNPINPYESMSSYIMYCSKNAHRFNIKFKLYFKARLLCNYTIVIQYMYTFINGAINK